MDHQIDIEELPSAWRALAGRTDIKGWQTIQIARDSSCPILAGRHFPGNEEALLVGFDSVHAPPEKQLPSGHGFLMQQADLAGQGGGKVWFSLVRQSEGNQDFFALMAADVVNTLRGCKGLGEDAMLRVLMCRVIAWQGFMKRPARGLTSEEEIGLLGEILVLKSILEAGVAPILATEAWKGPLDGIQDFAFGTGAIEVKTTTAIGSFPATVGSLDQLDESKCAPMFLAAVKLSTNAGGQSLESWIEATRKLLATDQEAVQLFRSLLLRAGVSEDPVSSGMPYAPDNILLWRVQEGFPRITRASVPCEIEDARYRLDLDRVKAPRISLDAALQSVGMV